MASAKEATDKAPAAKEDKAPKAPMPSQFAPKPGFDPSKFKIKQVTLPLLKFEPGATIYVTMKSEIREGKEIQQKRGGEVQMAPARIAMVHNIAVGKDMELIINKVLEGILTENYPAKNGKQGYVGKSFQITKYQQENKRYANFEVNEIENPA